MKNLFANRLILIFLLCLIASSTLAKSPLIGLTASFSNNKVSLNYDYVAAIVKNGGTPVILPAIESPDIINRYIETVDAMVLIGGPDIPPDLYGQKKHYTTKVMESKRFNFEKMFIKKFLKTGKPVLGICLGMQFSNALMGGTMYQDIPGMIGTKVCHRNGEMYTNFHTVGIAKGSQLEKILQSTSARVISRHHQAVDKVGRNLAIVARSSDGVIEALERTDGNFGIFVQWHPESMKDADPKHRNRLFRALIEAAETY